MISPPIPFAPTSIILFHSLPISTAHAAPPSKIPLYNSHNCEQPIPIIFSQSSTQSSKHSFVRPSQSDPVLGQMPFGIVAFDNASCSLGKMLLVGRCHLTWRERASERTEYRPRRASRCSPTWRRQCKHKGEETLRCKAMGGPGPGCASRVLMAGPMAKVSVRFTSRFTS